MSNRINKALVIAVIIQGSGIEETANGSDQSFWSGQPVVLSGLSESDTPVRDESINEQKSQMLAQHDAF